MDYYFVPHKCSRIALASLLNALEEYNVYVPMKVQEDILTAIDKFGISSDDASVVDCRRRLRRLYTQGGYARPLDRESPVAVEHFDRA